MATETVTPTATTTNEPTSTPTGPPVDVSCEYNRAGAPAIAACNAVAHIETAPLLTIPGVFDANTCAKRCKEMEGCHSIKVDGSCYLYDVRSEEFIPPSPGETVSGRVYELSCFNCTATATGPDEPIEEPEEPDTTTTTTTEATTTTDAATSTTTTALTQPTCAVDLLPREKCGQDYGAYDGTRFRVLCDAAVVPSATVVLIGTFGANSYGECAAGCTQVGAACDAFSLDCTTTAAEDNCKMYKNVDPSGGGRVSFSRPPYGDSGVKRAPVTPPTTTTTAPAEEIS